MLPWPVILRASLIKVTRDDGCGFNEAHYDEIQSESITECVELHKGACAAVGIIIIAVLLLQFNDSERDM